MLIQMGHDSVIHPYVVGELWRLQRGFHKRSEMVQGLHDVRYQCHRAVVMSCLYTRGAKIECLRGQGLLKNLDFFSTTDTHYRLRNRPREVLKDQTMALVLRLMPLVHIALPWGSLPCRSIGFPYSL